MRARLEQFRTANFRAAVEQARELIGALERSYRERGSSQVPAEKVAADLRALAARLGEVEGRVSLWRYPGSSINAVVPPGHGQGRS